MRIFAGFLAAAAMASVCSADAFAKAGGGGTFSSRSLTTDIKLGVAGPMTGANAPFGAQFKFGVEQAIADINAAGGVLGRKLSLAIGDDASDPKQAVIAANKFADDGVKWVVGHFNSATSIAASSVYLDSGILQITPGSTNPRLTELPDATGKSRWNVFRTCGRDDQQGGVAARYLLDMFRGKRVALLHDKTTYGKGLVDETKRALTAAGAKEAVYDAINTGDKDFSAIVAKLKAASVDVVYFGGLSTEAGLLVRQMRNQGLSAVLMSGDGIASDEFAEIAGPGAEGSLMTFPLDQRFNPAAVAIVRKLDAKGDYATTYALNAYAAVQVMKQAAEAAGSADPDKMAKNMHSGMTFRTVTGDIGFDAKGDMTRPDYVVYSWRKGSRGKLTYVPAELFAPAQAVATAQPTPPPPPGTSAPSPAPISPAKPNDAATAPVAAPPRVARSDQSRVALVVGNSAYAKVGRLSNPGKDAAAMADLFTRAGFQTVTLKSDLDFRALNRALSDFEILARNKDVAVIYYAGHGIEFGGQNYLVPTDAALERDVDIPSEAVPMERALRAIDGARRFKFLILDACRDDPFKASMSRMASTRSLNDRGLARVEPASVDTLIAYAAKAGTTASDGGGQQNSPFVAALLKQLSVPSVDVQLALRRVRDDVLSATGRRQEPYFYGSMGGDTVAIFD